MARQVRGQLIALKEQEFSMAALVIGASDARILFRHLLINAIGPIIVQITFLVPNAIFTEAFLSFIGIGISAPMASWGSMAQDARQVLTMHPGQLLLPTICICITIFSLNFLGEGIIAECKINCPVASCDRHRCHCTPLCKLPHLVVVTAC